MVCYYGIYPSNIPTILIKEGCKQLLLKYGHLSLEEIKYSYERLKIEKKEITLNLANIIDPVQKYHSIKFQVSGCLKKLRIEAEKEQVRDQQKEEFEKKALEVYRISIKSGSWQGDIFQATAIAPKHLAPRFEQDVKNEIWRNTQIEYNEIMKDLDQFYKNTGITPERLYSQNLVKHALSKNIKL
jgi:hypothetical protein